MKQISGPTCELHTGRAGGLRKERECSPKRILNLHILLLDLNENIAETVQRSVARELTDAQPVTSAFNRFSSQSPELNLLTQSAAINTNANAVNEHATMPGHPKARPISPT